jgi:hypothetical protein
MNAARAYKDVIDELVAAADALRERDRARAQQLKRQLVDLEAVLAQALERAALSRLGIELQRDAVLEALADESWMLLPPRPQPAADADPDRLPDLEAAANHASEQLQEVARRRFTLGRR